MSSLRTREEEHHDYAKADDDDLLREVAETIEDREQLKPMPMPMPMPKCRSLSMSTRHPIESTVMMHILSRSMLTIMTSSSTVRTRRSVMMLTSSSVRSLREVLYAPQVHDEDAVTDDAHHTNQMKLEEI